MLPRLLVAQPIHVQKWGVKPGNIILIEDGEPTDIGNHRLVNLLTTRQTAIRVDQHCSLNPPVEIYHDPESPQFRTLAAEARQHGRNICYVGTEVLFWLHDDRDCLATFLFASNQARDAWNAFTCLYPVDAVGPQTISLSGEQRHSHQRVWYRPSLRVTDFIWNHHDRALQVIHEFLNPSPDAATLKVVDSIKHDLSRLTPYGREAARRTFQNVLDASRDKM